MLSQVQVERTNHSHKITWNKRLLRILTSALQCNDDGFLFNNFPLVTKSYCACDMYICRFACVWAHVYTCKCRREIGYHAPPYKLRQSLLWTQSSSILLATLLAPRIPYLLLIGWDYVRLSLSPDSYMVVGDLKSGLYTFMPCVLPSKLLYLLWNS